MASMSKREGKVMPNIGAKRKRDPTFGASEKLTLISLVEQHFDVVESKKTDAVSMRQKAEEWRKLADTFNGTSSIHPREATVLKNCWENLKKRAKQELTQRNQSFMATGGGPPKKPNEDPAIDRVIDLIQARVSGFMNMYDSDGTNIASSGCDEPIAGTSQSVIVMSDAVIDNPQPTEIETTVTAENLNWAEYTPTMLRNPVNSELRALSPRQVDQSEDAVQEEQQPASATPLISSDYPVSTPRCPAGFSKCVYGGCVKNGAFCDGKKDCADNSDELLLRCRNETTYNECFQNIGTWLAQDFNEKLQECQRKDRTCKNGQVLNYYPKCDGKVDCGDGSDETLETCATDRRDCVNFYGHDERTNFRCRYGACVDQSAICNGVNDCADGSDELQGMCHKNEDSKKVWTCEDGSHISAYKKCNGAVDCPDGSDETFLLCRKNECPFGFRCVYGGCVNNSAPCNGVKDCADNSDELLLKCRNEPTFMTCFNQLLAQKIPENKKERLEQLSKCNNLEKLCKNGQILEKLEQKCDGKVDCDDGSDETLETCATDRHKCGHNNLFRCQDGGCVDQSKTCNKVKDCADGSDELDGLCYKGKCVLPSYPANGNYSMLEKPTAHPGLVVDSALLIFTCLSGYKLYGTSQYVNCLKGSWPYDPPKCLSQCKLKKDASINYWCLPRGPLLGQIEQECGDLVPDGATVRPVCSKSIYHFATGVLDFMHCVDGKWDRDVPTCSPHCGLVTQQANHLIVNAVSAKRGELPWHAGIYNKRKAPFEQICGGTLVTNTMVISAAHCFWTETEKLLPAENYAVALGKLYRPWNDKHEIGDQKSDVREIKIPPRYKGSESSFQEDIALVMLATPAVYRSFVLPACVDFGYDLERKQLTTGSKGKVSGWGLTAEDGRESPVLKVAELPYLDIDGCFAESPPSFSKFITGDKFCAATANGSALCKGDSGGGLVFPSEEENGQLRYFLRGIVSAAPRNDHKCNIYAHTTFTKISKHEEFILQYWN